MLPIVVSTWNHGLSANEAAWPILEGGGRALDAVEAGARIAESDPAVTSVGYGGMPDLKGHVTLDACIMDENGKCGAVAFLEQIENPTSVARQVMEDSPHVMLVGEGALEFALARGFERKNLLTADAKTAWIAKLQVAPSTSYPKINTENHDTIALLALDERGNLSGACTTSGAAWKERGRVGDSTLIGAGLFIDNDIGGACATGWGEAVVRIAGSHLVVEQMRQGCTPGEACRIAVERAIAKNANYEKIQVGFLAIDKEGRWGACSIQPGFDYAVCETTAGNRLLDAPSIL